MPEPNRAPYRIEPQLVGWAFWQLVEMRATVIIECDACHHQGVWTPEVLGRRSRLMSGKSFGWIARRLRCSACRSNWLMIYLKPGTTLWAPSGRHG